MSVNYNNCLSHPYVTTGKTIALTRRTFVSKVMSLLLNMLSRLERILRIAKHSASKSTSCLQSHIPSCFMSKLHFIFPRRKLQESKITKRSGQKGNLQALSQGCYGFTLSCMPLASEAIMFIISTDLREKRKIFQGSESKLQSVSSIQQT